MESDAMSLDAILAKQGQWARDRWQGHSGRRAPSLQDNLFNRMSAQTRREFAGGSGNELGRRGKPGKMSSLRSSSALSYNVFGPWRGLDLQPLSLALGTSIMGRSFCFEYKCRHGLRGIPPNLDIIDGDHNTPLGIECKFTEPYGVKPVHAPLDSKYFHGRRKRWAEHGLPLCQTLAERIGKEVPFRRLAAGQLLKHLLGLVNSTDRPPRLVYVWFDDGCAEAEEHRSELQRFVNHLDADIEFGSITYQNLFRALRSGVEPIAGYFEYLSARYFDIQAA